MICIKAPAQYIVASDDIKIRPRVFLAGSIEMGEAELWQDKVSAALKGIDCIVYNPRRDDWDSSWEQTIENPEFKQQVEWELTHIGKSDIIFFYFDPNTKSPITLLEFGICVERPTNLIVVCPEGFWRKGNLDVTSNFYGLETTIGSLEAGIEKLKEQITFLRGVYHALETQNNNDDDSEWTGANLSGRIS
jgi:hypothetical protein